jgi:hypothetical protein
MSLLIASIVHWVILPSIMIAVFVFGWAIASNTNTPELKASAWAGIYAGLVTFVIYVVGQLNLIQDPDLRLTLRPGLLLRPFCEGLGGGFVFLGLVRFTLPTRLVGVLTLMLSAASTSALFTYVFLPPLRDTVLYWTLGVAMGILLHIVLFPGSVRRILADKVPAAGSFPPPRHDARLVSSSSDSPPIPTSRIGR